MSEELTSVEQHEQAQFDQAEDNNEEEQPRGLTRQASSYIQIADVQEESNDKMDTDSA